MMGAAGLTEATQVAILNANYIARRLDGALPGRSTGRRGAASRTSASSTCASFKKSPASRSRTSPSA